MSKFDDLVLSTSAANADSPMGPVSDFRYVYCSNAHLFMRLPIDLCDLTYPQADADRLKRLTFLFDNTQKLADMWQPVPIYSAELLAFLNTLPTQKVWEQVKCDVCNGTTVCPTCGGECPQCNYGTVDGERQTTVRCEAFVAIAYANFFSPVLDQLIKISHTIGQDTIFYKYSTPNSPNLFEIGAALVVVTPHIMTPKTIDKLYRFERNHANSVDTKAID